MRKSILFIILVALLSIGAVFMVNPNPYYSPQWHQGWECMEQPHNYLRTVAFDGVNYLVVWDSWTNDSTGRDIYAVRISPSGTILDNPPIVVSNAHSDQRKPSVAFNGTNYLVVWLDHRDGALGSDDKANICGTRITPEGVVMEPSGIIIDKTSQWNTRGQPVVTSDGANYFIVYSYRRYVSYQVSYYGIKGCIVQPDGTPVSPFIIYDEENTRQYTPSNAFDGTNYLVVWQYALNGIRGRRVDQSGNLIGSVFSVSSKGSNPDVVYGGANYFVVYDTTYSGINGAFVDQNGNVLISDIGISTGNRNCYPSVSFDGTNYMVTWEDDRNTDYDIYGARLDQSGNVLDPSGIDISQAPEDQYNSSIAFDGTNYLVVWLDNRQGIAHEFGGWYEGVFHMFGARINQSGTVLDPVGFSFSHYINPQTSSSVTFDGNNYFVVWQDWKNGSWDIYGARITGTGTVLDLIPITTERNNQISPAVTFNGNNFLVVWADYRSGENYDIYAARVDINGTVLDPSGIAISTSATSNEMSPSCASDGKNYYVSWEDATNGDVYGTRVLGTGSVDPSIIISNASGIQSVPSVVYGGAGGNKYYFIAWQDERSGSSFDIYGARVNTNGVLQDPSGILISGDPNNELSPSVAYDNINTRYFIVWASYETDNFNICGKRVDLNGTPELTKVSVSTSTKDQYYPDVTFSGTEYLVVWQDNRSGTSLDIYGATVAPLGGVLEEGAISTTAGDQELPAVVSGSSYLITWTGFAPSYNTTRIYANIIDALLIEDISFKGIFSSGKVILSWNKIEETAQWILQKSLSPKEGYSRIATLPENVCFYTDGDIKAGKTYYYKLGKVNSSGYTDYYGPISVRVPFYRKTGILNVCSLTHKIIRIRYAVTNPSHIELKIYSSSGRMIKTLFSGKKDIGIYEIEWKGQDSTSHTVSSGIYFLRLNYGEGHQVRKIILFP